MTSPPDRKPLNSTKSPFWKGAMTSEAGGDKVLRCTISQHEPFSPCLKKKMFGLHCSLLICTRAVTLRAEIVIGAAWNAHGEARERRYGWVIRIGGEKRSTREASRVHSFGVIESDDGAASYFHRAVKIDAVDEARTIGEKELTDADLSSNMSATDYIANNLGIVIRTVYDQEDRLGGNSPTSHSPSRTPTLRRSLSTTQKWQGIELASSKGC